MDSSFHRGRNFGLDLFRAVAILLVVFTHGKFLLEGTALEGFPFFSMIDGVNLFFVLSGFLIGGILLREMNAHEKFSSRHLLNFWKRRWFRTLPNYYLILIANVIVVKCGWIAGDILQFNWTFFFFLQNFASPFYDFFWESWSLSVEEWFYLMAPFFMLLMLRITKAKYAFLIVVILMLILPFIYRISIMDAHLDPFWMDVTIRKVVLARLDSIAFGLLAAWLCFYYKEVWQRIRTPTFSFGVLLIVFSLNCYPQPAFYSQVISFSLAPIACMLLLPLAESWRETSLRFSGAIGFISRISYSLYLIHLALVAEVIRKNFPPTGGVDGILKYIVYLAVSISVAALLYRYFEKPVMDLREKAPSRRLDGAL